MSHLQMFSFCILHPCPLSFLHKPYLCVTESEITFIRYAGMMRFGKWRIIKQPLSNHWCLAIHLRFLHKVRVIYKNINYFSAYVYVRPLILRIYTNIFFKPQTTQKDI